MFKQILLPFFVLLAMSTFLAGQNCTPDTSLPDSIAVVPLPYSVDNPLGGIQDTACVGSYFETVFQINLPGTIPIAGVDQVLTNGTIPTEGGITNLPASYNYICNPPNCVFETDTVGCIVVYGTAVEGEASVYDLSIQTTLLIAGVIPYSTTLPNEQLGGGNYYLHVQESGSDYCLSTGLGEVVENSFDLRIQPNPISDYADIFVNLPTQSNYTFSVFNALGQAVQQEKVSLNAGENIIHFDGSNLAVGMYVFTLENNEQATSGRLLIQR